MTDATEPLADNDDICAVLDQLIAADADAPPGDLAVHALLQDFRRDHLHHAARLAQLRDELAA